MSGIVLLKEEHENIRKATKQIKEKCVDLLEGNPVDVEWFTQMITFCRRYADVHHHGKEERILFRIMTEELGAVAEKLIRNGMLVEHDLGRFHITELEKALQAYTEEPSTACKLEIITNASEYANLLNRHMDKEDSVVYPFAERSLNENLMKKVNQETIKFETNEEKENAMSLLAWLNK